MHCSVFIATSADGFIATPEGDVDWLYSAGDQSADLGDHQDMGFNQFIKTVDCIVMGRKCMEKISSMQLTPEQWPYGDIPIIVISHTLTTAPVNLKDKVELYSGTITQLIAQLKQSGYKHLYVDGGSTITSFLNLKLINQITITQAPVLLGAGIPLFGELETTIALEESKVTRFENDFVQFSYRVNYT